MSDLATIAPTPPTIIATVDGLDDLQDALRRRAEYVNVSRLELDRHSGLASGYSSKVLSPMPVKLLSVDSACALAAALGLDVVLIENRERLQRVWSRSPQRESNHANHSAVVHLTFSRRHMIKIGKAGGANSRKNMTRREAKMLARKAASARWAKELGRE
jgi:hypothetical protein